jgi:hypothetical protein
MLRDKVDTFGHRNQRSLRRTAELYSDVRKTCVEIKLQGRQEPCTISVAVPVARVLTSGSRQDNVMPGILPSAEWIQMLVDYAEVLVLKGEEALRKKLILDCKGREKKAKELFAVIDRSSINGLMPVMDAVLCEQLQAKDPRAFCEYCEEYAAFAARLQEAQEELCPTHTVRLALMLERVRGKWLGARRREEAAVPAGTRPCRGSDGIAGGGWAKRQRTRH